MDIGHRTFVIHNITDRNEVLNVLAELDTDGDFDGSNIEYMWEATKENGFESNQEFVINELNNNKDDFEHNGETIVTVVYSTYD